MGTGQLGGVLLGVRPVRLFRRGQALAQLGQLDGLRLPEAGPLSRALLDKDG